MTMTPRWGTIAEAMELHRVSRSTIERWRKLGLITSKPSPSGTPRILLEDRTAVNIRRVLAPVKPRKKK
ncbi:MAG: hypothetical protein RBU21_13875 [FCB group bacterium]|jgi:predicted site-specific integrase-resolvase|nr:hypothetical protein [FCB group bacterium]